MKCIKCHKELKEGSVFCNTCGANQTDVKKSKKGLILILLIVISIIITIGIVFLSFMIFKDDKNSNKEKENIIIDDSIISFDKYKIKIIDGFQYYTNNNIRYLKNKYCTIEFTKYPLTIKEINNNKDYLIKTLEKENYEIVDYLVNKDENREYITIRANLEKIEYGLVFYTIDDITILFKIVSNTLSDFDNNWYNYTLEFMKNIIYEEEYYE